MHVWCTTRYYSCLYCYLFSLLAQVFTLINLKLGVILASQAWQSPIHMSWRMARPKYQFLLTDHPTVKQNKNTNRHFVEQTRNNDPPSIRNIYHPTFKVPTVFLLSYCSTLLSHGSYFPTVYTLFTVTVCFYCVLLLMCFLLRCFCPCAAKAPAF